VSQTPTTPKRQKKKRPSAIKRNGMLRKRKKKNATAAAIPQPEKCHFFFTKGWCANGDTCRFLHSEPVKHAFEVDPDDHCETAADAYDDVLPVLRWLAEKLGKRPDELRIYDPYFCAGAVQRNLAQRGFPKVYNKNEDFYLIAAEKKTPKYDVLLTNPPYSEDHIEKCLSFCCSTGKPWLMLVPNYVYTNPYYEPTLEATKSRPFYIVPPRRYAYFAPGGVRSSREKKTSPFLSFWYGDLGTANAEFIRWWHKEFDQPGGKVATDAIARSSTLLVGHRARLPHRMRAMYDPTRRRLWKKQREAIERRKRKAGIGSHRKQAHARASTNVLSS
jgi:hypothetical protein